MMYSGGLHCPQEEAGHPRGGGARIICNYLPGENGEASHMILELLAW